MSSDGNFTVLSNEEAAFFKKLQAFYEEVRELARDCDGVIYSSALGDALDRVDPDWCEN
jgi:hypothetical protein